MSPSLLLLLLGFYLAGANYIKVEDFATDEEEDEEDEDWSAGARSSAQTEEKELDKRMKHRMKQMELRQQEAEDRNSRNSFQKSHSVSEFAEIVDEGSQSETESTDAMHAKLTEHEKVDTLKKRWKELVSELQAARVDEFLDGAPETPKTVVALQAEIKRLQKVKKMEGLDKEKEAEVAVTKKPNLLGKMTASAPRFQEAARDQRLPAVQAAITTLRHKVEAAVAAVKDSNRALDSANEKVQSAARGVEESEKLMKEARKEIRARDAAFAEKEHARLQKKYHTMVDLQKTAEEKLARDQVSEEELSGQLMLTCVAAALQEAHMDHSDLESFTDAFKMDLEKNELDQDAFLLYAQKQKNPKYLAGWGLFKRGPASIAAEPLALALKQLHDDVNYNMDKLAMRIYGQLCQDCGSTTKEL
eukprot:gnl/MRDRNA2_/MRDRNA2_130058_c0_seq1.p1 gnl/MRDRNA2_/MRDRNA2_130058_c0~~gnl/MRDRNA2_/MRDRNA2_130058_c0_seq1.p1  ORF type:complete len:417 (+),score=137.86 gnl/MRDRNA2_/MRDRNA2_130058_c0_seq1:90-1340(+)